MSSYSPEDRQLIKETEAAISAGIDLAVEVECWKERASDQYAARTGCDIDEADRHANHLWSVVREDNGGRSALAVKVNPEIAADDDMDDWS